VGAHLRDGQQSQATTGCEHRAPSLTACAPTGSAAFEFVASSAPDLDRITGLAAAHHLAGYE
jgi:hypothetical protein